VAGRDGSLIVLMLFLLVLLGGWQVTKRPEETKQAHRYKFEGLLSFCNINYFII